MWIKNWMKLYLFLSFCIVVVDYIWDYQDE